MKMLFKTFVFGDLQGVKDYNMQFWKNWKVIANAVTNGKDGAFLKFLGKDLFTVTAVPAPKAKASLKIKASAGTKSALKISLPKVSLGLKAKVAVPKVKVAAKVAVPKVKLAAKVAVPKVKLAAKVSVKKRRLQAKEEPAAPAPVKPVAPVAPVAPVTPKAAAVTGAFDAAVGGADLGNAKYVAAVPEVKKLAGESDQVAPAKSSLLAFGLLIFILAWFN